MNILVTGGAGFIGSNFIRYSRESYPHDRIVNLDLLTYAGSREALQELEGMPNYRFVQGDIADAALVEALFAEEQFDYVVNFAAESHVDRAICDPGLFVKTNVLGTQVLLDAARRHAVTRFHQISTDEVYGDLPLEQTQLKFTEQSPLKPSNPYSASKAAADLLVTSYYRTYGLDVTVSRCSNNYGPYQNREKLIPHMLLLAMAEKALPVYGDGKNVRDWIYAEDHCRAVDKILRHGRAGEIYNVGACAEYANIDVVKRLLQLTGKPETLISYVKDRPGHDRRYAMDASKLQKELFWKPLQPFSEGLAKTVQWYLAHPTYLQ